MRTLWYRPKRNAKRKIAKTEIAGMPAKRIRDILRELRHGHFGGDFIGTRKDVAMAAGRDITDALIAEKLLEPYKPNNKKDIDNRWRAKKYATGGPYYRITDAGVSLTAALALKRIDRARIDLYMAEMLQRADRINANPDLLCRITQIKVYGSYLEDKPNYGDIEIIVNVQHKHENHDDIQNATYARLEALNRTLPWNVSWYGFGEYEVLTLLKGRCPYLHITRASELAFLEKQELPPQMQVVYPRPANSRVLPEPRPPKLKKQREREFAAVVTATFIISTKAANKSEAQGKIADALYGDVVERDGSRELVGGLVTFRSDKVRVTHRYTRLSEDHKHREPNLLIERKLSDRVEQWPEESRVLDRVVIDTIRLHMEQITLQLGGNYNVWHATV